MQTLSLRGTPHPDSLFYVGELRMVQLPNRNFIMTSSGADSFMHFAAKTISPVIENFVFHKVLNVETEEKETKFLFLFRSKETTDLLKYDESNMQGKKTGYLERRICQVMSRRQVCTLADCVYGLLDDVMGREKFVNPGKELVARIIHANALEQWKHDLNKILFVEKMKVTIEEPFEQDMGAELNKIVLPLIQERNINRAFRLFSERIYKESYEQLEDRMEQSD
jgi:hypothetical protein